MIDGAYIGEIRYFAGNFVPIGWYACDGKSYRVNENIGLYAVLSGNYHDYKYVREFTVPKIEDLNGCKAIICHDGRFPQKT